VGIPELRLTRERPSAVKRWGAGAVSVLAIVGIAIVVFHHPRKPATLPVEHRWDVIGVVERVERAADYRTQPKTIVSATNPEIDATPSGAVVFRVGPERIHLVGGAVLDVPAATPGANACVELLTDAEKVGLTGLAALEGLDDATVRNNGAPNDPCVVIAALDTHRHVVRFSALDTAEGARSQLHAGLANVGGLVAQTRDRYLTSSGYAFRLDRRVRGDCTPDKVSLSRLRSSWPNSAYVDPHRDTIVEIDCLGMA